MKKIILILFIVFIAFNTYGQNADLVYVDGWVDIRSGGDIYEAFPGDSLRAGDSIITGSDSIAELEQRDLSSIIVKPDSIFTIREIESESGKKTVLSTTVGSVSFRFGKLFGKEPVIATPSMVAGIRGTELTVYAGEDGSTLIAVDSGLVTVESQGVSVDLVKDEGVEVFPGEVPGEKFSLLGREMDFATWNAEKYDNLIADPVAGLERMGKQMEGFIQEIDSHNDLFNNLKSEKEVLKIEWKKILEEKGKETGTVFFNENIHPIDLKTNRLFLNTRYYSLSSLSFRRYILGRLYLDMKSKYIMDSQNPDYLNFLSIYRQEMSRFEEKVVPFLDVNDI
jgi:FecR protein